MGAFLASLPNGEPQPRCPLTSLSLAKIRELHGGYKSICDNFAINLTEFLSIFSSDEETFKIFANKNGLIDALEIFSGLIIFSSAAPEEKIGFLFDLFDFNEIQLISLLDLEFMMQSVLSATKKIFDLEKVEIIDFEISHLVRRNFQEGLKVSSPQLLVWCSKTDEVRAYFARFRMEPPSMVSQKTLTAQEYDIYKKTEAGSWEYLMQIIKEPMDRQAHKMNFLSKSAAELVHNKKSQNFRAWLHTAL